MRRLTVLLFAAAIWHVGTAWLASGLDLLPFLVVVGVASGVSYWVQQRLVTAAELETEVWSLFRISVTKDVILSLVALFVSSMGFYWVVWPRYGFSGYLAALGITYVVPYALSSGFSVGL